MRWTRVPAVLLLAVVVLLAAGVIGPDAAPGVSGTPPGRPGPAVLAVDEHDPVTLDTTITAGQERLLRLPSDWSAWAQLGSAYVQRARVTADPSYYPRADSALRRSLALEKTTNWQAMVGMAALANARYDFRAALAWGRRAQRVNSAAGSVYGVLADTLTELGDYPAARDAVQRMLDVQPGIASFTRAAYHFELHGQVPRARAALLRALADATDPADLAWCRYHLGELAFDHGDLREAVSQYTHGIRQNPRHPLLRAGLAKAKAALGQTAEALREYERVVRLLPQPRLLAEYGDLLIATGEPAKAQRQYELVAVQQRWLASNGAVDRLTAAWFLADHGQPVEALTQARAEWRSRRSVLVADALAWALHRNGRDAEALTYATAATRFGGRDATRLYHRGAIRYSLGDRDQARRDLTESLATNPQFDTLHAPVARRLITAIDR